MEKELGAANQVVTADMSAGLNNLKETVFNILANFFSWLSTHQGIGIIIILIVLAIIIWLILRARRFGKQLEEKVSSKDKEIAKKDTLIAEQKNKLAALQNKLADQQGVVSESLLRTIMTLTGYDIDQLKIFFKFLTEINGNPLHIADTQVNTGSESRQLEEEGDDSAEENEKQEIVSDSSPEEVVEANKKE